MVYSINLLMCAISAFCFKNVFTFLIFLIFVGLLFQFAVKKLSNITILLYILNVIIVLVGGFVIWLLPNKEDIIPSIIVDDYYLGPLQFILLLAFLISVIYDIVLIIQYKNKNKKKAIKNRVEIKEEKNKEFKEKVEKIENSIKEKTEKIKKIVETKKEEQPKEKEKIVETKKEEQPKEKKKVVKKTTTKKKTTKKPVKKVTKKEEK